MSLIKLEVSDYVALVTMDNPPVNAQPIEFMEELTQVFDTFNDRNDVRVAVITGAGKVFSAGADLKNRPDFSAPGTRARRNRVVRELAASIQNNNKPSIAAVNGAALGAGLGIATSCDIIVASERAVFGLPEVDVGLMGGGAHSMRVFPHSLVRRMMLTGYRVPADEVYRRGLIEASLPHDELLPWAMKLAGEIAAKSPMATRLAKESMRTIETMPMHDAYIYEQNNTARLFDTYDAGEAARAFVEKRAPVFEGR